ncbi:nuclear fragile X mental retardation-interacting protein 2 [Tachyglossus aculeatus]|uniref:nuclear fragile X mental retardation-interacting protein 2 n=1 Tax=Tachyglossus aculeatus TaxID=9261 RepID=UPI0018F57FE4|nr:nuclear fragile X mental retardation-interacting protein 2 [Tachyglossus aculeatus]
MEEKPGQSQPHHHSHHHPQQQQQQQPPPHHHHHHHYYYYNHNHHHHHQQTHQYLQHGAEGSPKAQPKPLKHEQKHALQPHQETPKKKTGYGEINGNAGDVPKSLGSDEATNPISRVLNGSQQAADTNLNPKQTVKTSTLGKAGLKTKNFIQKNSMDKRNEKSYDSKSRENPSVDKADAVSIPNGVVTSNASYITNGYVGKGADNDGSGSESGYTTPKKRKARRNSAKGCENLNLLQDKIMQQEIGAPSSLKQGLDGFKPDYSEPKGNRLDGAKPLWKYEPGAGGLGRGKPGIGDILRKNSDAKPGMNSKKFEDRPKGKHAAAVVSKEDSWTLFKPPPVFPVDNSSAKIVPKISYASKVKENLNKAAQSSLVSPSSSSSSSSSSTGEAQAQTSSRLSQVPMSAMKSVTSATFSNGPVLAGTDGSVYSPGTQPLLAAAASTVPPVPGADSVLQDTGITSAAVEQIKSSLFIYPSNMQTVLLGTTQVALPAQTDQQNLGDIFQNQWGLSFINDPSAGPETGRGEAVDNKMMEVTFQGECPAALVSQGAEIIPSGPEYPVFPKAYELDKRTSPQGPGSVLKPGTTSEEEVFSSEPSHTGDLPKADPGSQGALVFLSKDYEIDNPLGSPSNTLLASAKEQRYQRGLERKDSWGSFDLRAAIIYHTKEMESIWNLQKQDPKRIITYDEAMDSPDQ